MKLDAKKSIVFGILISAAVAVSIYSKNSVPKNPMLTASVEKIEADQLTIEKHRNDQPRDIESGATNIKSLFTVTGSADPVATEDKIKDIDVQIDVLSREVRAAQKSVDTGHIKEQLNLESLPPATRELYFAQLKELARLRRQVIELRFRKIEILHSAIDRQAARQLKAKS